MYCKNCGKEINTEQAVCLNCGVKNGVGNKFCSYCGKEVDPLAEICLNCGMAIKKVFRHLLQVHSPKRTLIKNLLNTKKILPLSGLL